MTVLAAHLLTCGAIAWACLCRLQLTRARTAAEVRWSISLTLTGAVAAALGPLVWSIPMHLPQLVLEMGFAMQLIAFRRIWRGGAPAATDR